jgi:hypothetical protein
MILVMAFYAVVGEKVPWLIIPQLLPMCFVAVYKLNWQKMVFAIIGCLFLAVMTWHVAFIPADINEPIVQVQNSEDLREVMGLIDASDHVVVASKNYWPLPWYYRGERWNKIKFYGDIVEEPILTENNPGVIILHDAASTSRLKGIPRRHTNWVTGSRIMITRTGSSRIISIGTAGWEASILMSLPGCRCREKSYLSSPIFLPISLCRRLLSFGVLLFSTWISLALKILTDRRYSKFHYLQEFTMIFLLMLQLHGSFSTLLKNAASLLTG